MSDELFFIDSKSPLYRLAKDLIQESITPGDHFFYNIRNGNIDNVGYNKIKNLLISIKNEIKDNSSVFIDRKLVRYLWSIPLFMHWQKERISEQCAIKGISDDEYLSWCDEIEGLVYDILGAPDLLCSCPTNFHNVDQSSENQKTEKQSKTE